MVDRPIVTPAMLLPDTILLAGWKAALYAVGHLSQATLGTSTCVSGLIISATSPPSLSVTIGSGSIYYFEQVDATAYGSLGTDSNSIVKQGLLPAPVTLAITPPTTAGYTQVYLVEASYSDVDGGAVVEPYYNSANPMQPFSGPNNSGASQNTVRSGALNVALKAGGAAPTGTQTTPTVDPGYVGLYTITVANGQTSITSSNWATYPNAPFVPINLNQVPLAIQEQVGNYAQDTGSANAVAVSLPAYTVLTPGIPLRIRKGASPNNAATTISVNTATPIAVSWADGSALAAGDWPAYAIGFGIYDGTRVQFLGCPGPSVFARTSTTRTKLTAATNIYINSSTGSDSNTGTSAAPFLTIQAAVNYVQTSFDLNGQTVTFIATGTFSAGVAIAGLFAGQIGPGAVVLNFTSATLATVGTCVYAAASAQISIISGIFASSGSGSGQGYAVSAGSGAIIVLLGGHTFGVCVSAHIAGNGGIIEISGSYAINGGSYAHVQALNLGQVVDYSAVTVAVSGNPNFSGSFAQADYGFLSYAYVSFTGTATGQRYTVTDYGRIYTNGGGANFFPGSTAGSVSTGTYS